MKLEGKVVLVTGGSSGLGKATAKLLAENGAKVMITGRDQKKVEQVAKEINAVPFCGDVTDDASIDLMFEELASKVGSIDVLINNAGIGSEWPEVDQLSREQFQRVFDVNVFGAAMVGTRAATLMKEKKRGTIINIASTAGLKGFARGSVYVASKFALRGMTQCWQAELRPYNIRVMGINPSEVPTAFNQENREEREEEPKKLTSNEIAHSIFSILLMDERGFIPELSVWATNPF